MNVATLDVGGTNIHFSLIRDGVFSSEKLSLKMERENLDSALKIIKDGLVKNYQIVNSKATNPKYRICFEKCKLIQMEV